MQLSPRRLFFGTSTALVLAAFFASIAATRASVTVSVQKRAAASAERLDSLLDGREGPSRALSLAYLERARLGLGSPYRLIDQVIHDSRLADTLRHEVAWAIVGRVFDGAIYQIDPLALDLVSAPGSGAGHLAIIENAIEQAENPRVGEAAVRIAYGLASSKGATSLNAVPVVAEAAAQVRDRVLAARDLRQAVPRAVADGVELIDELMHLRTTRELAVERPLLEPLTARERADAIDAAPAILRRIELVAPGASIARSRSLVDRAASVTLARLAPRQPPLAAMRVIVNGRVSTLRADSTLGQNAVAVIRSTANEESLVAAFGYADEMSDGQSPTLHRLMVSAGVALRAHAQDRVWFAGDVSPSTGSVIGRFGLRAITFDRDVPSGWRPFYSQMIASALEDFARVVPGYDPTGLAFHVEMRALPDSALAMHDPRTHTIRLAALTPSGTLAHELAHDVDWQAARRLFAKSGGYATDRSVRESGIRLASSVRGLTSARVAGRGRVSPRGSSRPAEVFARSVDWYVADALAAMGRSNGYLSAIGDPVLAGFATMPGDAPSLDAATALVRSLAEMTYVPDSLTAAYVRRWESLDRLDPSSIVLRAMDAPMITRRAARVPFGFSPAMMTDLATGPLCQVAAMRDGSPQERLLAMAIEARARGIVVRRARYTAVANRPAWARAILGDPLANPDATEDIIRRTIAGVAEGAAAAGLIDLPPAPFRPRCG